MYIWKEPSKKNILYLPTSKIISNSPKLFNAKPETSIHVSNKFLTYWHEGPQKNSLPQLAKCLAFIIKTLAKFTLHNQKKLSVKTKTHPQDLVTIIDQGIELLLRLWIKKHFPQDKVIGEEGVNENLNPNTGTWYIDPIDGTFNFINQSVNYGLQLCYIKNSEPILAYLYLPKKKESFLAIKGNKTSSLNLKKTFCIGTEFLDHKRQQKLTFQKITEILNAKPHRIKAIGPHILDLYKGNCSAFYKEDIKIWDLLPPLAFLKLRQDKHWIISLFIDKKMQKKIDPFDTSSSVLNYYNLCQQKEFRIGTVIITPKNLPNLEEKIISILKKQ